MNVNDDTERNSVRYWKHVTEVFRNARAVGLLMHDRNGTIIDCSTTFGQLVNRDRTSLIGLNLTEITAPEWRAHTAEKMHVLFDGVGHYATIKYYLTPTGDRVARQLEVQVIEESDGQRLCAIGWIYDVPRSISELIDLQSQVQRIAHELAMLQRPASQTTNIYGGTSQNNFGPNGRLGQSDAT